MIKNIRSFCKVWGADNIKQLERQVYKNTECGASIVLLRTKTGRVNGVKFISIVEGSEAEYNGIPLMFPFSNKKMETEVGEMEDFCAMEWAEANS